VDQIQDCAARGINDICSAAVSLLGIYSFVPAEMDFHRTLSVRTSSNQFMIITSAAMSTMCAS
jgi:hypothetical protein